MSYRKEILSQNFTINYRHQENVTNCHHYNSSAQVVLPLRCKQPGQIHSIMMELLNTEPDCVLVITFVNVFCWRGDFGGSHVPLWTHMPSASAGLSASAVCPAECQACPWDAGWKGETVWHREGLRITGCLIITSSGQQRVDTSLTI